MKFAFPPATKNTNVPTYTPQIIFGAGHRLIAILQCFLKILVIPRNTQHENNRGEPTHHPWLQM